MSSGAEKLKDNKSIAILDAAERGGYGISLLFAYVAPKYQFPNISTYT